MSEELDMTDVLFEGITELLRYVDRFGLPSKTQIADGFPLSEDAVVVDIPSRLIMAFRLLAASKVGH